MAGKGLDITLYLGLLTKMKSKGLCVCVLVGGWVNVGIISELSIGWQLI